MLAVEVDGERRRAWADESMVGPAEVGDDVVVNTAALDLGLGSGGYDIVHVNLTRGLGGGETPPEIHVMKLNYSSLQHAVDPIELPDDAPPLPTRTLPVLVLPLHGHLAPAAWAAAGGGSGAGRVRAGGRRWPAGRALVGSPRAERARLDRRFDHRLALLRRRARGDQPDRSPPRGGGARLGCGHRRPRPRHPRLLDPLRARRDGGARSGALGARARPADAGLAAHVLGRSPPATPRPQPPHALGPRPAPGRGRGPGPARARRALAARRRRARGGARGGAGPLAPDPPGPGRHPGLRRVRAPAADDGADARRGPAVLRRRRWPPAPPSRPRPPS